MCAFEEHTSADSYEKVMNDLSTSLDFMKIENSFEMFRYVINLAFISLNTFVLSEKRAFNDVIHRLY